MSGLNEIIAEVKAVFGSDSDIATHCATRYGNSVTVKRGGFSATEIPIKQMPVIIISDDFGEGEKRRFLYSENEARLTITCGILQSDIESAESDLITLKELIKQAVKKDPQLNQKAVYSSVIKSKRLGAIAHPLYFMELTMYVQYKS